MTNHHVQLRDAVYHAMNELLSDTSVSKAQTKDDFKEIIEQAQLIIESLDENEDD